MISSIAVNGAMGILILIPVLFGIEDLDAALNSKAGFPSSRTSTK